MAESSVDARRMVDSFDYVSVNHTQIARLAASKLTWLSCEVGATSLKAGKFCEDPESFFFAQGYRDSDKAPLSMHSINRRFGWLAMAVLKVFAMQLSDYASQE